MRADIIQRVQRPAPSGGVPAGRVYLLHPERLHPVIHIAHREAWRLELPERIILDHELVLILDGRGELLAREDKVAYGPHDVLAIPPFVPHAFRAVGGGRHEHVAVHFDCSPRVPALSRDPLRRPPYAVRFTEGLRLPRRAALAPDSGVERGFLELLRLWSLGTGAGRAGAQAQLQWILVLLLQHGEREPAAPGARDSRAWNRVRIERAMAEMRRRIAEPLSIPALARAAGLSPSHFTRLFREWTGYAPLEHLRRQRIELAKRLLADVDLPIKHVAARTGFGDPYHFSKAFHQLAGLPPSHYRAALMSGNSIK